MSVTAFFLLFCNIGLLYLWCFTLQNRELQIMRKLEHQNIVKLKFFFYSSGEKVRKTRQKKCFLDGHLNIYSFSNTHRSFLVKDYYVLYPHDIIYLIFQHI